jgi:hypothetical protein
MSEPRSPIFVTLKFDPEDMSRRGKIGAHIKHSRYDSRESTAPARQAFDRKFENQVDPEGTLSEEERLRRAQHARKAYFARLALASARARRKSVHQVAPGI